MRNSRATFGTRLGFYLAAVGSACGLGTLWRFPYLTGLNGGGGFLFLYIFFVAIVGLPVLISELMLGKLSRSSLMGAVTSSTWGKKVTGGRSVARLAFFISAVVLSYYSVVSGWVLYFIGRGIIGSFNQTSMVAGTQMIDHLLDKGVLQVVLTSFHLIVITWIVARGVRGGIERSARIIMPVFFIVVVMLLINSLFLPGTREAIRFMLYPSFANISSTALIEALGHALYTLSVGFGAMVAYGSYVKDEVHLPSEALLIAALDTLLAICGGLIIFPIVFTAGVDLHTGPALIFKALPVLFGNVFLGYWMGIVFFVCLYFAAVCGTLAIFEGMVSHFVDYYKFKRARASIVVGSIGLAAACVMSLSGNVLGSVKFGERSLLDLMDLVTVNWTFPIVSLGVVLFLGYVVPDSQRRHEFINEKSLVTIRLYSTWLFAIRYVVPFVILGTLLVQGIILLRS